MKKIVGIALVTVLMAGGSAYAASDKAKGKSYKDHEETDFVVESVAESIKGDKLSREERVIIRTVFDELFGGDAEKAREYEAKHKGKGRLPPGLQKQLDTRGSLPPGLEKHIHETGTLPPGLESRRIPDELHERLGELGQGRELVWLDDDVYLIETATRAVIDVVKDVFSSN